MNNKIYVKNKENYIYELDFGRVIDSSEPFVYVYGLELIAGIGYIDYTEYNDKQGYVPADRFDEDIQYYNLVVYSLSETILDRLEQEGYEVIEELPVIYA